MAQYQPYAPSMYGCMYWDSSASPTALTNAVQNTWYGITSFTQGVVNGITTDTSDATADHFTVPTGGAGDYVVAYQVTHKPASSDESVEFSVFVGGSEEVELTSVLRCGGTTSYDTAGGCAILTLADADEVDLRHRNISGTGGTTLYTASFSIRRVSP